MHGFGAFLRKELREILKTWRIWVLPGIVLFFALSGPPLAKVTPELLGTLMSEQQPGVVIQLPDPTYVDAYLQWTKNLSQLVLFAVIIMFGGAIAAEKKSGTAILVLTKPLSRTAFVVSKFISQAVLLVGAVSVGALLTWAVTYAVFGEAPAAPLAEATGAWLAFGVLFMAVMLFLSAVLDSQAGAAGIGFAGYIVVTIAGLWEFALKYTPAALVNAPTEIVMDKEPELVWPIVSALALTAVFVGLAVAIFRKREL